MTTAASILESTGRYGEIWNYRYGEIWNLLLGQAIEAAA